MVVLDNSSTICNTSNVDQKEEDDILTTSTICNTTNTDSYNTSSTRVSYKDLLIDTNLRKVFVKNKVIKLTSIDYKILKLLMQNVNKCISRDDIIAHIWNYSSNYKTSSDDNLLNTHISIIRHKIKRVDEKVAKYIVTEKCYGYRLGDDFF